MQTFTMTQLAHETGMVADAVDREAAMITRHGRPRYVMLRADDYERLFKRLQDPRRVLRADETPEDIVSLLADDLASLDDATR